MFIIPFCYQGHIFIYFSLIIIFKIYAITAKYPHVLNLQSIKKTAGQITFVWWL